MRNKISLLIVALFLTGCATTNTYQKEFDAGYVAARNFYESSPGDLIDVPKGLYRWHKGWESYVLEKAREKKK